MQTFQFDLSEKNTAHIINVKQGDVGRKFKAVICDGGMAYSIPLGVQFSVWFSGPGGEGNYSAIGEKNAFAVEENSVTVELAAQMLTKAGTGAMCLVMNGADGTQLGLWNVVYVVEAVPGMESEATSVYYTALSELATQAIRAAETFKTDTSLTGMGKAADAAAVGSALAEKAPAGYGLGEAVITKKVVSSLDEITAGGGYALPASVAPQQLYGDWEGYAFAGRRNGDMVLVATRSYNDDVFMAILRKNNGVWGGLDDWAWLNPPMSVGVEYRTTEFWNGKAVYVRMSNCGVLPENNVSNASVPNLGTIIGVTAIASGAAGTYQLPALNESDAGNKIAFWNMGSRMFVKTFANGWSGFSLYVTTKYTKD